MINDVNKAIAEEVDKAVIAVKAAISHYESSRDALKKYLDELDAALADGRSVKVESENGNALLKNIRANLDALYSIK